MKWGLGPLRLQMGQTAYVNCGGPRVLSWTPGPAPGFTSTSTHDDESIGCSRGVFSMFFSEDMGLMLGYTFPWAYRSSSPPSSLSTSAPASSESVSSSPPSLTIPSPLTSTSTPRAHQNESDQASLISPLTWRASPGFVPEFIPISDASYARRRRLRLTGIVLCALCFVQIYGLWVPIGPEPKSENGFP